MARLGNCPVCKAKMVAVTYPQKVGLLDDKGRLRPVWREVIHCSKESAHTFDKYSEVLKDLDIEAIKLMQKKTEAEVSAN